MSAAPVPVSPHDRQHVKYMQWRERLARQLGTSASLAALSADSLERAVPAFRRSAHPDAWIAATLCAAELERRAARVPAVHSTGLTAAEVAWTEQKARRAAA